MQALTILKKFFSVDMVIYAAIVIVAATALLRCTLPLSRVAAKLRRAARTIVTESKQNKEKKSWNDMHFLGDSLSATWADFLQNAEMRDAHGETCDVTQYINEDTVIYALGSTGFAGLAPGVMTSLGILGTFLGLVMGLSGLSLTGADTEVVLTAMDQLIRGMSTAFLTSIAGVCVRCCLTCSTTARQTSARRRSTVSARCSACTPCPSLFRKTRPCSPFSRSRRPTSARRWRT